MNGSWRKYLQLGVVHFMMFPDAPGDADRTVETARRILADDFFGVLVVGRMPENAAETVRAMADDAHVSLVVSAAPFILANRYNLASLDEQARRSAIEAVKPSIHEAHRLGSPVVELFDGRDSYPGADLEQRATDQLVRSLVELCQYAEDGAMGQPPWIVLECFDRAVEKRSLVGPSSLAVQVAARVRAQQGNFGVTVDMGHVPLIGESYREALESTKEYLVHVHLGNCVRDDNSHPLYGDTHPCFGIDGGVADVPELVEFLAALQGIGYFERPMLSDIPWLTFEVKPQSGQSSELLIANCKRVFKEAWARL